MSSLGTISKKMLSLHDGRMAGSAHLETGLATVVASFSFYLGRIPIRLCLHW